MTTEKWGLRGSTSQSGQYLYYVDHSATFWEESYTMKIFTGGLWGEMILETEEHTYVDIQLSSYFENWLHPSEEECTLWKLEFGYDFVDQNYLDQIENRRHPNDR